MKCKSLFSGIPQETICMKCKSLFSGKIEKYSNCRLLKLKPSMLSIKDIYKCTIYCKYWGTLTPYHTCPKKNPFQCLLRSLTMLD